MTFDKLIQHVTDALPGRKLTLRFSTGVSGCEYGFLLWGNGDIVKSMYAASVDALRDKFDAWLAEQDFTSAWDGVHVELQEAI